MDNKINGKTPEEIKKGLAICGDPEWDYCRGCPFEDDEDCIEKDRGALAYIQQLEARIDTMTAKAVLFDEAVAAGEKYKRERDVAVEELRGICRLCNKYNENSYIHCNYLGTCVHVNMGEGTDHWQWRGVQEVE